MKTFKKILAFVLLVVGVLFFFGGTDFHLGLGILFVYIGLKDLLA